MKNLGDLKRWIQTNEEDFQHLMRAVTNENDVICLHTLTAFHHLWAGQDLRERASA